MQILFENVLRASLYGSSIILCLLLARPLLKKVPKKYLCLLWLLAFLRLLMPFEIPFDLSLQPDVTAIAYPRAVVRPTIQDLPEPVPAMPENAPMPEDVEVVYGDAFTPPESIPEGLESYYPPVVEETEPVVINWNAIGFTVWAAGTLGLALYGILSYVRLKRIIREAVRCKDDVWECAGLETAFILGWLRPRVYLPMGLTGDIRHHILRHERAHLRRKDPWLKLLGFLALTIHWFNPLVWVAWVLLCRDMELACDELVVKDMGLAERKDYSAALLWCSTRKEHYLACPVAFGEVSVKARILSVLNYRRPRFWISLVGIVAILFVAVFLMTSPVEEEPDLSFLNYKNAVSLAAEQKKVMTIYCVDSSICPGEIWGDDLARLLDTANWRERRTVPRDQSSPGSIEFIIEDDYRITLFDRKFARVKYAEEVRYYRIPRADYEAAVRLVTDPVERELTEEEILIERCQSAMEAIMYADAYHIGVTAEYTSSPFLTDYWEAEYWKHYSDRMSSHYPDSDTVTAWVMERSGSQFKRTDCANWVSPDLESQNWKEAEFNEIDEDRILPWFHFVDWNRDTFSVSGHTVSGDTEEIVLNHSAVDDYGDQYGWIMTFRLDKNGNLLGIDRALVEYNGLACAGTFTTTFYSFDPDEVYDDFLRNAHPPGEDHREELLRCYSALCWHQQMMDYRHTRMHVFLTGDMVTEGEITAEYWHTPLASARKVSREEGSADDGWLVEKNGNLYCKGIKRGYPEDVTDYSQWVEAVDPEESVMTTWLEEYKWDFSQIEFLSSQEQGDRTVITFRVNEILTDNLGGTADHHDVTFCVSKDNELLWAADKYTILGTLDGDAYGYMVSAEIQILTYDTALVEKQMEEALAEIQFPY